MELTGGTIDRRRFRRAQLFRLWLGATVLLMLAGVGLLGWLISATGNPADWMGDEELSGESLVLGIVLVFVLFVPTAIALAAALIGWYAPRVGAVIGSMIPLGSFMWISALGGSVNEDPLLLVVILPATVYLILCASIFGVARTDTTDNSRNSHKPRAAAPEWPSQLAPPEGESGQVVWSAEPPYRDD